jgi:uncharacterized tellurite resistance protein B-like protein
MMSNKLDAYRREVERAWQDGVLTAQELLVLEKLRETLGISLEEDTKIQMEIKRQILATKPVVKREQLPSATTEPASNNRALYESMLEVALADGKITQDEDIMLESLRKCLAIDEWEHIKLKRKVLDKIIHTGAISDHVIKYSDAVKSVFEDGVVTSDERKFLDALQQSLHISPQRAKAIEFKIREEFEREEKKTPLHLTFTRYMELGKNALHAHWFELATKYFDKVLKIKSNLPEVWCDKALALSKLGKYRDAISCCKQALKLKPDYKKPRDISLFCLNMMQQKIERERRKI